jgi:hypothetical protein
MTAENSKCRRDDCDAQFSYLWQFFSCGLIHAAPKCKEHARRWRRTTTDPKVF